MKYRRYFNYLFWIAYPLLGAALVIPFLFLHADPIAIGVSEHAVSTADAVMQSVCQGDYAEASHYLYGMPDLGVFAVPSDTVGGILWDAFVESTSYELVGDCFATNTGLAQKVLFSAMDFSGVTSGLKDEVSSCLAQQIDLTDDLHLIYDTDGNYREDFIMGVLATAAYQSVEKHAEVVSRELVLTLTYQDGQWWVLPDRQLIRAISGGVAG